MHRKLLPNVLAGAVILVGGCHSSAPPPASQVSENPTYDACGILTQSEIAAATGWSVDAGQHIVKGSPVMCGWFVPGVPHDTRRVSVNFSSLAAFNREKGATTNVTIIPVSGVGDEAYYVTSNFGTTLFLRKGNNSIAVGVMDQSVAPDTVKANEKALALNALRRMGSDEWKG